MPYRVYYEDTDAGGIVYHANYLKFAERARTDWLREHGIEQSEILKNEGLLFVVYRIEIDFLAPARLDDLLNIQTRLLQKGHVRMKLEQAIKKGSQPIASLTIELACIDREGKPSKWPEKMAKIACSPN